MNDAPVHDHIEELLAADALGGLDASGQRELERALTEHEPGCAECARLRAAHAETAAALALSLDPVPMSHGAEERLMASARAVRAAAGDGPLRLAAAPEDSERRPRRRLRRMAVAALAAAACLAAAGFVGYALHRPPASSQAVPAFAEQSGTRSTRIVSGSRRMVLYYRPGQGAALVVGSGFPAPPSGHVYELWYLPVGSQQMAPAGIFVPRDGSFVAPASVGSAFTVVAVSIEPHFVPAPTGPVVLSNAPASARRAARPRENSRSRAALLVGRPYMLGQFFFVAAEFEDDACDEDDVDDAFGVGVLLAACARVAPPTRTPAEIVSAITAVLNRCLMSLTSFPLLGSVGTQSSGGGWETPEERPGRAWESNLGNWA